ncbi:hypothetical protein [Vulcanococcus limneticus]|uniref:hypothetical protein n=1 Tax=Vulcanococcus limneticus TaxID=2170428 RepID=UPI00398C1E13
MGDAEHRSSAVGETIAVLLHPIPGSALHATADPALRAGRLAGGVGPAGAGVPRR